MNIGILALQGAYAAHSKILQQLGVCWRLIRFVTELEAIDGLIIPGGESSSLLSLLDEPFLSAIQLLPQQKKPIFGTCAGAVLLADKVINPNQTSLGLIEMTVERNGYGRQLDSRIVVGECKIHPKQREMIFIRAPRIRKIGKEVEIIAKYQDEPVAVQQDLCLATSFHPELSNDSSLHQHFLTMVTP